MPRRYESLSFSEKCCWLFPESRLCPPWQTGISLLAKSLEHKASMRVAAFILAIERVVKVIMLRGVYA
jgi:hypothetical protein